MIFGSRVVVRQEGEIREELVGEIIVRGVK